MQASFNPLPKYQVYIHTHRDTVTVKQFWDPSSDVAIIQCLPCSFEGGEILWIESKFQRDNHCLNIFFAA